VSSDVSILWPPATWGGPFTEESCAGNPPGWGGGHMRSSVVRRLVLLSAILALPAIAFAQDAVLTGTITDSTGGVLPVVTVQAINEGTGNTFESVTDGSGVYRIPARVGTYRVTATLTGFSTVNRTGINLLVGQTATINLQMAPSTLQETVTVTGEAPLIETTTSKLGGNIDPKQVDRKS